MSRAICIIQARMGSSRLKGKVLKKLSDKQVLEHVADRVKQSKILEDVIIATTVDCRDDVIEEFCKTKNINIYRGSENDVLERYYFASQKFNGDIIVRITSDCPCIDYKILDEMLENFKKFDNVDYYSNTIDRTFPRGYDIEIFKVEALKKAYEKGKENYEREHVTPFIYDSKNDFKIEQFKIQEDYSDIRVTLDTEEDFIVLKKIFTELYKENKFFGLNEVVEYINKNTEIKKINENVVQKKLKE